MAIIVSASRQQELLQQAWDSLQQVLNKNKQQLVAGGWDEAIVMILANERWHTVENLRKATKDMLMTKGVPGALIEALMEAKGVASSSEPQAKKQRLELPQGPRSFCVTCGLMKDKMITVDGALTMENVINKFKLKVVESKTAHTVLLQDVAVYHKSELLKQDTWLDLVSKNSTNIIPLTIRAMGRSLSDWNKLPVLTAAQKLLDYKGYGKGTPTLSQTTRMCPCHYISGDLKLWIDPYSGTGSGRSSGSSVNGPEQADVGVTSQDGANQQVSQPVLQAEPQHLNMPVDDGMPERGDWGHTTFDNEVDRVLATLKLNARIHRYAQQNKSEPAHRSLMYLVWQLVFIVVEAEWPKLSGERLDVDLLCFETECPVSAPLCWGKLDWAITYKGVPVFFIEGKGGVVLEDMWPQVYASTAAIRHNLISQPAVEEDVPLVKQKHYEVESLKKVPTLAALCQADKTILFKYLPAKCTDRAPKLLQSEPVTFNLRADRDSLRKQLVDFVQLCVGAVVEQLKALQKLDMAQTLNKAGITDEELEANDAASQKP